MDRQTLEKTRRPRRFASLSQALESAPRAVRVKSDTPVRVFPRTKPAHALVHVLNWDYDPAADQVRPARNIALMLDLKSLGVAGARTANFSQPQQPSRQIEIQDGFLLMPEFSGWGLVELTRPEK